MNFKQWLLLTEKIMIKDQEFRDPLLALQHIQKIHPNPENLVVTFTAIDKVGINPTSEYKTPIGIYFYPLNYVIENEMDVPFAGDQPYLNVCEFTRPQKILHMNPSDEEQKGMQILYSGNVFSLKKVYEAEDKIKKDEYNLRSDYSMLWLVTKAIANDKPSEWNSNLRKCGVDGFVDHGTGTIHPQESTQGVVFAKDALKVLYSIDNNIIDKNKKGQIVKREKYNPNKISDQQLDAILKSHRNIEGVLKNTTDKDKMAELIINKKTNLSDNDIKNLSFYTTNEGKVKIAELILKKKTNLSDDNVLKLLGYAGDHTDHIAQLIVNYKTELSDNDVRYLTLYSNYPESIKKLIINKKPKISYKNIKDLIHDIKPIHAKKTIELIIAKESKFYESNIIDLIRYVFERYDKSMREWIVSKLKISPLIAYYLFHYTTDKKEMANLITTYHGNTPEIQKEIDKYLTQTQAAK